MGVDTWFVHPKWLFSAGYSEGWTGGGQSGGQNLSRGGGVDTLL